MKRIALVLLSTVLLSVNTSAWALFGDDEARKAILELRDQLKSQQEVQMSLYDRLEKLTKEVQTLRGKVEDLTNSVGKEKQNAETIYDDLSNRLNEMDPKAKAAAAASDREISAKQELDRCLSVFQKGDANQAIKCFSGMTQKYSRTKVYPDALYWQLLYERQLCADDCHRAASDFRLQQTCQSSGSLPVDRYGPDGFQENRGSQSYFQ